MTQKAFRHWVPDGTAPPHALATAIAEMARQWSGRWFVGAPFAVVRGLQRRPKVRLQQALSWQSNSQGIAIGWADHVPGSIATRVLGWESAPVAPGERDLALLDRIADECLGDFKARCRALAKVPDEAAWTEGPLPSSDGYELEIGTSDGLTMVVAMTAERFALAVRQHMKPVVPLPLGDGRCALHTLSITLSAHVGDCRVSLAELEHLGMGDVLILDRAASDPMPLAINGHALPRGRCVVSHMDRGIGLKITEPLMGRHS